MRWIALLRGVNVGGVTIRSAELATVFRDLGVTDVVTVLASGNVAFTSPEGDATGRPGLKRRIERALADRFGYDAWIVLVTRDELRAAAEAYPFAREDAARHPYLVFGSDQTVLDLAFAEASALADGDTDAVARGDGVLFWRVPRGSSTDTPVARLLAAARWRSTTTTRNMRTVERLLHA